MLQILPIAKLRTPPLTIYSVLNHAYQVTALSCHQINATPAAFQTLVCLSRDITE